MGLSRCLIVDDDELGRELVMLALPGVTCVTAVNGREALDRFTGALDSGEPFDLIILDIVMPQMDGHEAGRAIRQVEKERGIVLKDQVKIIMLTARNNAKDVMDSMMSSQSGAYLVKPLNPAKLKEALSKLGLRLPK